MTAKTGGGRLLVPRDLDECDTARVRVGCLHSHERNKILQSDIDEGYCWGRMGQ